MKKSINVLQHASWDHKKRILYAYLNTSVSAVEDYKKNQSYMEESVLTAANITRI